MTMTTDVEPGTELSTKGSTASEQKKLRAESALQLKMAGATWEEVARVVGYTTPRQAVLAVEKALSTELRKDPEAQARMRALAGQRLERLLRGVWAKAIDPNSPEHLTAVAKAKDLVDRHIKLYGLDAPTELVVHTPTKAALEEWVDKIVGMGTPDIEEPDIFDADWEEVEQEAIEGGDDAVRAD